MITFLKGDVVSITQDHIEIDVNGVGYQVMVGKPQDFSHGAELVYTYMQVKEDSFTLYGFKTKQEKDLFLRLIDVSGIGPKTASGIIGATTVNSLISAIELGNVAFLKKLPSVGAKAAQQIILDLKGKLVFEANTKEQKNSEKYSDVYDALRQFGFKVSEIDAAINKIENLDSKKTPEIIKECLKNIRK